MADGTASPLPSAMPRIVLHRNLPEPAFGRAATTSTLRTEATRLGVARNQLDHFPAQQPAKPGSVCRGPSGRWHLKQQAAKSVIAVSPASRHQPRLMGLMAGSFAVEKVCSAPARRAQERRCAVEG
jgi:hypothetical protein